MQTPAAAHPPLRFAIAAALAALAALAASSVGLVAAQASTREVFSAFAVSTGGPRSGPVAQQVSFTVERWSSEAQRRSLAEVLQAKGPDGLLDALRALPEVGSMRTPTSLAYPLHYADQRALPEGGRRIVLATDRPITFSETWNSSRTLDYPFTVIELQVNKDGEGEGKLSFATKVVSLAGRISLENWSGAPVQLNQVRRGR